MQAVDALLTNRRLTLMEMARAWPGAERVRAPLKALDRLLSNPHLYVERESLYANMARWLLRGPHPVIVVDWSDLKADKSWCLLRAAVPVGGRTLTILDMVFAGKQQGSPAAEKYFLKRLKTLVLDGVTPILVTDAGFRNPWFRVVEAMGWYWLGRLRHRTFFTRPGMTLQKDAWLPCRHECHHPPSIAQHLSSHDNDPMTLQRIKLALLVVLSLALVRAAPATDAAAPADGLAQVVSVNGHAVSAANRDTLMGYVREHHLDQPDIQLKPGQWLRAGNVVLALENASVVLRWRNGRVQQVGPHKTMTSIVILPPRVAPSTTGNATSPALRSAQSRLQPLLAFERHHRPSLIFVLGVLLALAPLAWPKPYRPGLPARLLAGVLFIALTLPVSLRLFTLQLGRMAWYQPPQIGIAWTGVPAILAHVANVTGPFVMAACVLALWVLSISFISGGSTRLMRRSWPWWVLCFATLLSAAAGYLAPYAPNVDFESAWYRFWAEWARFYSVGTWLLLPVAQLVACARPTIEQTKYRRPWQGAAASGLLILFVACYALGYDTEYDVSTGMRADEPASRAEARRWICAAQNVFVGTASDFHVINDPSCAATQPRSPGDTSGLLQRCEIAEVKVHVDEVLRSPNLVPGQTIAFQIGHARIQLDGPDGLQQRLEGKHLFHTREQDMDGRIVHIGAARLGADRLSPLNFNNAGNAIYGSGISPECW